MLTVVTWLWQQPHYRSKFDATHVNTLRSMVSRHMSIPHEFVCVTNTPEGIDSRVRIVPISIIPEVPVPEGRPNCFRRLWAFSEEAERVLGPRILSLDLDCVITADLAPAVPFHTGIAFKMWGDTARTTQYNGSMVYRLAGRRRQVWDEFIKSPAQAWSRVRQSRLIGSDQAWISLILGRGEAMWTAADGVYSFRNQIATRRPKRDLPPNARIVFFHGLPDPWEPAVQRDYPWIKEHYR